MPYLRKKKLHISLSIVICLSLLLQSVQSVWAADIGEDIQGYEVSIMNIDNGQVQADSAKILRNESDKVIYEYAENETVEISMISDQGWQIAGIEVTDQAGEVISTKTVSEGEAYSFIMPKNNVTVKAKCEQVSIDGEEIPDNQTASESEEIKAALDAGEEKSENLQDANRDMPNQENTSQIMDGESTEETDQEELEDTEEMAGPEETEEEQSENLLTEFAEENGIALAGEGMPALFASPRSNTITYHGKVTYGNITVGHFSVNGSLAYCMEHKKTTPPTGTSFAESVYDNANIRKALYYGYGGNGQWSGFSSEAQGIVCTSLALSYYYSGADSIITLGGPTDATVGVSAFLAYCDSQSDPQANLLTLSKSYTESYISDDRTYQRTENITFNADSKNTITFPLPEGVTLVNETTGATGTGNVSVKGGDTFYLKAGLNMNGTWSSGDLYGSMGKFQAVLCMTGGSNLQNIGQGRYYATDPDHYVNLSVKWVQMGDIRITKFLESDDEIKTPAVGAEFTLTHQTTGEQVVITVGDDGVATTEDPDNYPIGRLEGGEWKVEETYTPEGFKTINPFTVTVYGQGQIFSYIAEDKEIYAPLQIVKVDASTNKVITRSGATFKIVDSNGNDVEFTSYSPSKQTFTEFTTDGNGQYTLPEKLPYGNYKLVEVKAPEGYLLCDPIDFTVDEYQDWETPMILTAADDNTKGKIKIEKKDAETKAPVKGAVYEIIAAEEIVTGDGTVRLAEGEKAGVLTTDADGRAESEELYLGKYIVKETETPEGYVLDTQKYEVELVSDDQEIEIVYSELEVIDKPTKITITKKVMDQDRVLEGVKFWVWNKGMESEDVDPEMGFKEIYTTDENGQITLGYLAPGNYCVQEKETLPGYILDETIYEFSIDKNGMVQVGENKAEPEGELTVTNDYTKLQISKRDIATGEELPGAKLELIVKETGEIYESWTSGEEPHYIEMIPEGEYILRETMAPEGYLVAKEISFTVAGTGEVQQVVMEDEWKEGTITTSTPSNFRDGNRVKTGDTANIIRILAILLIAGIVVIVVLYRKKKGAGYVDK